MVGDDNVLSDLIKKHGWAVMRIGGSDREPNYAYSVGLFGSFGHPEVIVFGLPADTLEGIINVIGDAVSEGKRLEGLTTSDDILEGNTSAIRPVDPAAVRAFMGAGLRYYNRAFPALHIIWPDSHGRFPWDPGTSADYRRLQPKLNNGPEPSTQVRP